jgi:hypothetical protein
LHAVDIFAAGIDGLRPALGPFPVVLEGPPGQKLRLVELVM